MFFFHIYLVYWTKVLNLVLLALQAIEGEKPIPTPKRSTFRLSMFFKNLMKKCEEEKVFKDKSTVTITAEVHREMEMPRYPPGDRKKKTPGQMIQAAGRFSMQVADISVNVEVIPPHAKQAFVSTIASGYISKAMGEKDPSKHPFQKKPKTRTMTTTITMMTKMTQTVK